MKELATKYVNMGKDWLVGEYGEWEHKTTEIDVDNDEIEVVDALIEAICDHEEVFNCKKQQIPGLFVS